MNAHGIFQVLGLIVIVALVATIVGSTQTQGIITSLGSDFSGAISSAKH